LDLFDQGGDDRLAVKAAAMDLFDPLQDLIDVEGLAGSLKYVIDAIDLRHTFWSRFGGWGRGTKATDGSELGFERDLESMKDSRFNIGVVWHGTLLLQTENRRKSATQQVGLSICNTYILKMSKLQRRG
jgi:hypothetical protein